MASNDEGQGSGDCDDIYRAADEFFSLTDDQPMLLLGPPVASGTETDTQTGAETDTQTGAETETDAEIQTGIETGAETGKPERLQGFRGQCQTGPREFASSSTTGG